MDPLNFWYTLSKRQPPIIVCFQTIISVCASCKVAKLSSLVSPSPSSRLTPIIICPYCPDNSFSWENTTTIDNNAIATIPIAMILSKSYEISSSVPEFPPSFLLSLARKQLSDKRLLQSSNAFIHQLGSIPIQNSSNNPSFSNNRHATMEKVPGGPSSQEENQTSSSFIQFYISIFNIFTTHCQPFPLRQFLLSSHPI